MTSATVTPFRIDIPQQRLDHVLDRLRGADWPDRPEDADPWAFGASYDGMRELIDYLLTRYSWREQEAALNRWPQFMARVEDYDIHFLHVQGSGRNPQPLILSHGWPGSFLEFIASIDRLTRPERHGGSEDDAFSVVIPSLPGFGFSSKPRAPIGVRTIGRLFDTLMTDALGYGGYIAQGGDYGAGISGWMGYEGRGCRAVHLNFTIGWTAPDARLETPEELQAVQAWQKLMQTEGGYIAIQGTKPLSLAFAMSDSPIGVAAWLFEKFHTWPQLKNGDMWQTFTREEVLNNIMLYILTDTFGTASWMYTGGRESHPPLPAGARVTRPVGICRSPGEMFNWPRSYMEKSYTNLVRWAELPAGGHFAAMEQPQLFVEELRTFRRQLA
jgi:microsomal epoxide hydrolase